MNAATDRRLRRLALVAAPIMLLLSVSYAIAGGIALGRIISIAVPVGSFIATGLLAWELRPANRMGRLMVAAGACYALALIRGLPWPELAPIGLVGGTAADVLLGYLILAFPSGQLRTPVSRWLIGLIGLVLIAQRTLTLAALDPATIGLDYENPYRVIQDPSAAATIFMVQAVIDLLIVLAYMGLVVVRWLRASAAARRALSPVAIAAVVLLLAMITSTISSVSDLPFELKVWFSRSQDFARATIPVGFLVGLLRIRVRRGAVADLVLELGRTPTPAGLRDALAKALGDPTLDVAYWSPAVDGYIDSEGSPVAIPAEESGRGVALLARGGEPLAAILHDPALLDDPGLVASVASALRLAVENERLQAEVVAQLDEVRASRTRIVEAGDAERKRVERDLHDGAQQRLVSLAIALRLARSKLGGAEDAGVRLSLEQASEDARAALSELRELARGIHPQILTSAGLGAAVESLADHSPVDVSVEVDRGRYPPAVEQTAYYVVSEALANIAKYAHATHAAVRTDWNAGALTVEVADDGVGGADPDAGTGLRGLADRLAAIDGTIEITSSARGGTRILARIPTAAPMPLPG
jgi:signal transduction histidine kinase